MEKVVFKKIYPKSETALAKCCSFKKGAGVDDVLANACRCFWCLNGHAPQGQACGRERGGARPWGSDIAAAKGKQLGSELSDYTARR